MKKMLQGAVIALIAVVGSVNATSIKIAATHKVLVYVNYGDNTQCFQVVEPNYPIQIETGAFAQDRSKIQSIWWKEVIEGTITGWISKLDIPRVLAGATFAIGKNGSFAYNFNLRGKGKGQASEITKANDVKGLVGGCADTVQQNLTATITKLGAAIQM